MTHFHFNLFIFAPFFSMHSFCGTLVLVVGLYIDIVNKMKLHIT